MSAEERIANALAYLRGQTIRLTPCSKHPPGHEKRVGEQPDEDFDYIAALLQGCPPYAGGGNS